MSASCAVPAWFGWIQVSLSWIHGLALGPAAGAGPTGRGQARSTAGRGSGSCRATSPWPRPEPRRSAWLMRVFSSVPTEHTARLLPLRDRNRIVGADRPGLVLAARARGRAAGQAAALPVAEGPRAAAVAEHQHAVALREQRLVDVDQVLGLPDLVPGPGQASERRRQRAGVPLGEEEADAVAGQVDAGSLDGRDARAGDPDGTRPAAGCRRASSPRTDR